MNLENLTHADFPFNHWVFSNCLEEGALDEISYSNIPSGDRMYDGTRAADHTGQGVDGKLRLFITKNNYQNFLNIFLFDLQVLNMTIQDVFLKFDQHSSYLEPLMD